MEAIVYGLDLPADAPLDKERLVGLIHDRCQGCTAEATMRLVEEELTRRRRADARAQADGWRSWAQAACKNGGRQAHRYARRRVEDSADLMRDSGAGPPLSANGQQAVDVLLEMPLPLWVDLSTGVGDEPPLL